MKVALYNHTSVVSGAEISLLLSAKHLPSAQPILFAPEGELMDRALSAGLQAVPIPGYRARLSRNPLRWIRDLFGMLWAGLAFARAVRSCGVDLVHANSLRAGIMAAMFLWLHRRPLIWHVRDNLPRGLVGTAIQLLARLTVKTIVCISQAVRDAFDQRMLGSRLSLVHNGVELRDFTDSEKSAHRNRIRKELDTPPDRPVLVIIGQIAPWKRQEDAVNALHRLVQDGQDVYLWIVGEAKFREENHVYLDRLHRLVGEFGLEHRVRFTGFRQDVMEICAAADVLLLCSENEPFGRVLIEAMSQSIPVVATNAGGVPDIVVHESSGLLYETGDVDALARHVSRLLQHPLIHRGMGRLAAQRVRDCFTIERTAAMVEELYFQLVPGPRASAGDFHLELEKPLGKEYS